MTTMTRNDPIHVNNIATPTDAVLIRSLGPDERAACRWCIDQAGISTTATLEVAYYDPEGHAGATGERDGNYAGSRYACGTGHALAMIDDMAASWLPGAGL